MKYKLGLDMGATSIGWSIFDIENQKIVNLGVRIFDDGREDKTKASLCVKRRNARGTRRLQNRKHIKTQELINKLIELGLFPKALEERQALKSLSPYQLRSAALDEQLPLSHFGRALFQLSKRKGFKSNRKDDKEEGGKLKNGYEALKAEMVAKNARTYGEYLYKKHLENPKSNLRLKNAFDDTGKFLGGLFPFREIYKNEFNLIWKKQATYYPDILTEENRKSIENILFFQRPLKEQEEGYCRFEKNEKRIPKSHPLFQEFRIWQNVLNLTFAEETSPEYEALDLEKTKKLIEILYNPQNQSVTKQGILSYSSIKKELNLNKNGFFNFEKMSNIDPEFEKGLIVNRTQQAINQSTFFLPFWRQLTEDQKGDLINILARPFCFIELPKTKVSIEDEEALIKQYLREKFVLSEEAVNELLYDIPLENDYGSLSEKAIRKILLAMKQGMIYSDACAEAGYHHSVKEYTELDKLPYYGEILEQSCLGKKNNPTCTEEEFGKIGNATVHVALNQIRHLINELIDLYGKPFDIAIEYARDLNASAKERLKMMDTRDKNEVENKKILKEMNDKIGVREYNKRDLQKYKIWKNMGIRKGCSPLTRECPFSGDIISIEDLMNGHLFQIEHIIPFSRSLDDSLNNKVLASVTANRYKGNRTPYEAFGESKDGYDWQKIQRMSKKLPFEQQWRFSKDAMKKFEEQTGPIARSLNDTRYMTTLLQSYLQPIVREDGKKTIQSVVGSLTSMVRKSWGLNQYKNKEDEEEYRSFHNHHAIDALIASAIDRAQIAEVSKRLKGVSNSVIEEFRSEFYKLKDPSISKEEKADLRKKIKDFTLSRQEGIINQYINIPENIKIPDVLTTVEKINISHKPSLKKINDKKSTIGQLHEDSAYGLQKFVDSCSLEALFKSKDKNVIKNITEYIPMFYNKEDKNEYYHAYKEWFILDRKSKTMIATTHHEKALKNEITVKEQESIQKLRETAQKAFKWFVGGGNFCAEIYQINPQNKINGLPTNDQSEWKTEIISNYNATIRDRRGEDIAYWRYKYPNAKRIMTLRRNDMVLATFTKEQAFSVGFPKGLQGYIQNIFNKNESLEKTAVLFRIKKMGGDGRVFLTPHNIAKEEADTKSWGGSAVSLQRYNAQKVWVTSAGRIKNA